MIKDVRFNGDIITFNPAQKQMINQILNKDLSLKDNDIKQYVFMGGFRSGKSFLFQLITFLLCLRYPKLQVIYVRRTYDQLKDSVIKQFRADFEKYGQFTYVESSKEGSRIAKFRNGSTIVFRAFDRDTNILSAEYDLACVCQIEDIQEELYKQLFGRLSGSVMPKTFMMVEGNPKGNWVKRAFYDLSEAERAEKKIYFLNSPTTANLENLPKDYLDTLRGQYSERDFKRWALGEWQNLYGLVFSEFDENINIIPPINPNDISPNEKIMIGGDYGWRNPSAFVWGVKTYDDDIIIFDEFYKSECLPEELARENKKHGTYTTVMDFAIKRADRDGKSLWDTLIKLGLRLVESNKDEFNNLIMVNSLFKQHRLFICSNCVNLIWEIKNYKFKEPKMGSEKNYDEEPIDKDNHAIDALLYLTQAILNRKSISEWEHKERKSLAAHTHRRGINKGLVNYG